MSTTTPPKPTIREKIHLIVSSLAEWERLFYGNEINAAEVTKKEHKAERDILALLSPQTGKGEISEEMEKELDKQFNFDAIFGKNSSAEKEIKAFLRKHLSMQREADKKWVLDEVIGQDEYAGKTDDFYEADVSMERAEARNELRAQLRSKLLQKEVKA